MSDDPRVIPRNELDLNMLTTESVWGKSGVSSDLKDRLSQLISSGEVDEEGRPVIYKKELWGLLSFYTRDVRLANLDRKEMIYCKYYLDLAGDFLQEEELEPFMISLSRAASTLELSQSKKGFLRKRFGTFTHEQVKNSLEPKKMSIMGKTKGE